MYSFAQRSDFEVIDEPLFAHFLKLTGAQRPSRDAALRVMSTNLASIQDGWMHSKSHVFIKHMANHLEGTKSSCFQSHHHVFLIRDPRKVILSFQAHINKPTSIDLCFDHQWQWLQECIRNNWPYFIVDSDSLVANPEFNLRQICAFLKIPFEKGMLSWNPGPRPEDGVWAKYWYHRVHASSGWEAPVSDRQDDCTVPVEFSKLLAEVEPVFRRLQEHITIQ